MCAFPVYIAQALGCSAGTCLRPALCCMHFPGLSRSGSGTWTQFGLRFVPFPGPSSSGDLVFGKHGCCHLSPPLSLPAGFLGAQPAHLLRRMLTVQNPKKSWLAMKPACSFVDNASLGPQLPASSSDCLACLSLEGNVLVCSWLALLSPKTQASWCLMLGLFAW